MQIRQDTLCQKLYLQIGNMSESLSLSQFTSIGHCHPYNCSLKHCILTFRCVAIVFVQYSCLHATHRYYVLFLCEKIKNQNVT